MTGGNMSTSKGQLPPVPVPVQHSHSKLSNGSGGQGSVNDQLVIPGLVLEVGEVALGDLLLGALLLWLGLLLWLLGLAIRLVRLAGLRLADLLVLNRVCAGAEVGSEIRE